MWKKCNIHEVIENGSEVVSSLGELKLLDDRLKISTDLIVRLILTLEYCLSYTTRIYISQGKSRIDAFELSLQQGTDSNLLPLEFSESPFNFFNTTYWQVKLFPALKKKT